MKKSPSLTSTLSNQRKKNIHKRNSVWKPDPLGTEGGSREKILCSTYIGNHFLLAAPKLCNKINYLGRVITWQIH